MPNGTCPHHEHIDRSITRIDNTCERERGNLWSEINELKRSKIVEYRLTITNLVLIVATLATVLLK